MGGLVCRPPLQWVGEMLDRVVPEVPFSQCLSSQSWVVPRFAFRLPVRDQSR
jgi:hypothetical protein